ncbi:hypothetical protein VPH35_091816 [Triticum aestivum]
MASQLGSPLPWTALAKYDPAATTIAAISDDLLREILLRLPSLPSLVRAPRPRRPACRAFLRAARTSTDFRRRFMELHPPQILGIFEDSFWQRGTPAFVPFGSRSDPDVTAAVSGADFHLTGLPENSAGDPGWEINTCHGGYLVLHNQKTRQLATYNPLTQALDVIPYPAQEANCHPRYLACHIVFFKDDPIYFGVVCVRRRRRRLRTLARLSLFSSDSSCREWQSFPWVDTSTGQLPSCPDTLMVDGFAYWKHIDQPYIVVLDNSTLEFSRVDLPPDMEDMQCAEFRLGQTKDGYLCMVDIYEDSLVVCCWGDAGDGVDELMTYKVFPLSTIIDATMCSEEYNVQVSAVVDGFVFLSVKNDMYTECILSLCLETESVDELVGHALDDCDIHPYIMAWPPSLVGRDEVSP